jgi:hypothetical protein
MPHGTIRTTTFRVNESLSKEKQERIVGDAFKQAYKEETGILLEDSDSVVPDPPDRLFCWQGLKVGAELFELEQLYAARALVELLTNETYAEFECCGMSKRYPGVTFQLVTNLSISTAKDVQDKWQQHGITKNPAKVFASEFLDLVQSSVTSREVITDHYPGMRIQVDQSKYPALAAFGRLLIASKSPVNDIRRSDGQASPLVILGGAITYSDSEIEDSIAEKMIDKMRRRSQWKAVNHAILIAHDLPRHHIYQGFGRPWEVWLERVATRVNILQAFDELWLVTCRRIKLEAEKICGREPAT